jgi:hypothetical protein
LVNTWRIECPAAPWSALAAAWLGVAAFLLQIAVVITRGWVATGCLAGCAAILLGCQAVHDTRRHVIRGGDELVWSVPWGRARAWLGLASGLLTVSISLALSLLAH